VGSRVAHNSDSIFQSGGGCDMGRLRVADEAIVSMYQGLLEPKQAQRYDRTGGWFARYSGRLADPERGRRYIRGLSNTIGVSESRLEKMRVLDVGCGFGLTCVTLAALGAKEVHGIDAFPKMIDTINAYLPDIEVGDRVHVRTGQADALPYKGDSFDLVFVMEALSHFIKPYDFLNEARRVLRPGGLLVLVDDNNGANPRTLRTNQEVWDRFENGPPTEDIHGHRVLESYVDKRSRIIRTQYPNMKDADVDMLARGTAYMTKAEVLDACAAYLERGVKPESLYRPGRCPVEPEQGQFIENVLNPLDLKDALARAGFGVHLEAYFGGASRGGIVYFGNWLLNRVIPAKWLLRVSPGFRIWARK